MKIFKRIKWSYVVLSVMFLLLGWAFGSLARPRSVDAGA